MTLIFTLYEPFSVVHRIASPQLVRDAAITAVPTAFALNFQVTVPQPDPAIVQPAGAVADGMIAAATGAPTAVTTFDEVIGVYSQ